MKKTYIQPTLQAIEMKYTTTLLSGSETLGVGSGTKSAGDALGHDDDYDW